MIDCRARSARSATSAGATCRTGARPVARHLALPRPDDGRDGALGDLGAHVVDLARYLVGELAQRLALAKTFIPEPPGRTTRSRPRVEFESGAIGTIEATRLAARAPERFKWEINGSKGSLAFDMERLNEMQVFRNGDEPKPRRASRRCSSPRPTIPSGSSGGRPATSSAGATRSCTSSSTCCDAIANDTRRRPARRDVRGRLPRRRGLRRDRPLGRERHARAALLPHGFSPNVISRWDRSVVEAFQHLHWGPADWFAELLSDWWVKSLVIIGIGLVADIWWRRFPLGVGMATISYLAAEGLSLQMKSWFDRERPSVADPAIHPLVAVPHNGSMPSTMRRARSRLRSPSASSIRGCGGGCSCSPR